MAKRDPWTIQRWAADVPLIPAGTSVPTTGKRREELATRRLILINLAIYAKVETGECFPAVRSLARRSMCSTRTVQRHLIALEEMGLVTRHEQRAKNGAQQTTRYTLSVSHLDDADETEGSDSLVSSPSDSVPSPGRRLKGVSGNGDATETVEQPVPLTTPSTSSINPFMNVPRKRPAARKRPGGEIKTETAPSRSSVPTEESDARSTARENGKEGGDTITAGRERFSPETLRHYQLLRRGA